MDHQPKGRRISIGFAVVCIGSASLIVGSCGGQLDSPDSDSLRAQSTSWQACSCGDVIGSDGINKAKCNGAGGATCAGTGAYGDQYQCVELVERVFGGKIGSAAQIVGNAGRGFCDNAASIRDNNGRHIYTVHGPHYTPGGKPSKGDALVWNQWRVNNDQSCTLCDGTNGCNGHMAVVTGSDANNLYYLQQNWGWYVNGIWGELGNASASWSNGMFGPAGADLGPNKCGPVHPPACWIHRN